MCVRCNGQRRKDDDFKHPYVIPGNHFGAWDRCCESENIRPDPPICVIPGKPKDPAQLAKMLCQTLDAVKHLCKNKPAIEQQELIDIVDLFLKFDWLRTYKDLSNELQEGAYHHVYTIIRESLWHGSFQFFTYEPLAKAMSSISLREEMDGYTLTEQRIKRVVDLIFSLGHNKQLLGIQLDLQVGGQLDGSWIKNFNDATIKQYDYSIATMEAIVAKKLGLMETLKEYALTPGVTGFVITESPCNGIMRYNLCFGSHCCTVNNTTDLLTFVKMQLTVQA